MSSGKGASAELAVGVWPLAELCGLAAATAMQRRWRLGGGQEKGDGEAEEVVGKGGGKEIGQAASGDEEEMGRKHAK